MLMTLREIIAAVLVAGGVFFFLVGVIGLIRLPDIYMRVHATAKGDTLGLGLCLLGAIVYLGFTYTSLKLLLIITFIWITSPTAAHLIGKSDYRTGVEAACGDIPVKDISGRGNQT